MDDFFPISNIPLIFTQYRSKILEESGKQWFHAGNNPQALTAPPETGENHEVRGVEPPMSEAQMTPEHASKPTESIASAHQHKQDSHPKYFHPDPWDSDPIDAIANQPPENVSGTSEARIVESVSNQPAANEEGIDAIAQDLTPELEVNDAIGFASVAPEQVADSEQMLETDEASQPSHSAQKVNLFPFDQDVNNSKYDLTEFDNGEIEVPPVAVRESQQAKFKKVKQVSPPAQPSSQDEDPSNAEEQPSKSNRNQRPKSSSAEIAKYRLRNCI